MRRFIYVICLISCAVGLYAASNPQRDTLLYQLGWIDQQILVLNNQKNEIIRQIKSIDEATTQGITSVVSKTTDTLGPKIQPRKE